MGGLKALTLKIIHNIICTLDKLVYCLYAMLSLRPTMLKQMFYIVHNQKFLGYGLNKHWLLNYKIKIICLSTFQFKVCCPFYCVTHFPCTLLFFICLYVLPL